MAQWSSGALVLDNIDKIYYGVGVIDNCAFFNNTATDEGAVALVASDIQVKNSTFVYNHGNIGAAIGISGDCVATLSNNTFLYNTGGDRGAVSITGSTVTIENTIFSNNTANDLGGAVAIEGGHSKITIVNTSFFYNNASFGGAIYSASATVSTDGFVYIHNNTAITGVVYFLHSTVLLSGNTTFTSNYGSLFAFNSGVSFLGLTVMMNNSYSTGRPSIQQGGAVTSVQSDIEFQGAVYMSYNKAKNGTGGAILAIESTVTVYETGLTVTYNDAYAGAGIFAYQSQLHLYGKNILAGNRAIKTGGGIHAVSATVSLLRNTLQINDNVAERGGGVFLELNARLYVLKSLQECVESEDPKTQCTNTYAKGWLRLEFTNNSADYGGAIFVSDNTNSAVCASTPFRDYSESNECFFQSLNLALHPIKSEYLNLVNVYFTNNSAIAGAAIYGSLLDRCIASKFAEMFNRYPQLSSNSLFAISYIHNISNLQEDDIASDPGRVCFCHDNQPNCSYRPPIFTIRGQTFTLSAVAVDQVNNLVPATIRASLSSQSSGFSEGEIKQYTFENCTQISYTVFSPNASEKLSLYAEGPCKDIGISTKTVDVLFLHCPVGFALTKSKSSCDCDPRLEPFITICYINTGTLLRIGEVWIDSVNSTNDTGYLIYPHCPFDYCYPPTKEIHVNLNAPNGADNQCAHGHSGKLCGKCKTGLSLSLGSTHCRVCSNYWLLLLIPFALAGVALVACVLILNLTVAVGTINGLVFYANVIASHRDTYLPFAKPNFLTVFIAWLNLDFGFETCFYDGLDAYVKTWLQFVFPLYIIFLVAAIIVISDYSPRFAGLFTGKNPVATLATLILLSYTKLLRTVIAALSFAQLTYPDGSHDIVWLLDANVPYLKGKHIPLFIAAVVTALIGLIYTLVLFFWQGLLRCPIKRVVCLKWMTNSKLLAFVDAYHAPYEDHHRYWIGMFFVARSVLYLISAVNVLGDPRVNLVSVICVMIFVLTVYATLPQKPLKTYLMNLLELAHIFNLTIFTALSFYFKDSHGNQTALAYVSTTIGFLLFAVVVVYHTYTFALRRSRKKILTTCTFCIRNTQRGNLIDNMAELPNIVGDFEDNPAAPSETEIDGFPSINSTMEDSVDQDSSETLISQTPESESDSLSTNSDESVVPLLVKL